MRKKLLVVVALCLSAMGFSQNKNFVVEDKFILWRMVYDDSTHFSELKNKRRLSFVTDSTGYIIRTDFADRRLYGELTADFKIESKHGKYRVSVFNIRFFEASVQPNQVTQDYSYSIERNLLKNNGTIRKSILGYDLTEILNPNFTDLFMIKKSKQSDW